MDKDHITFMRSHAHELVKLARKLEDATVAGQLEAMAIELLKRARSLENSYNR